MFVLLSGAVAIDVFGVKVAIVQENNVVGETALQSKAPRSASVVAVTDVVVLKLRRTDYESVLYQCKKEERYDLTRRLMKYPCFAEWEREKVLLLTNFLTSKTYGRDQGQLYTVIYEQGQPSTALYVLTTGKVKLQADVKIQTGNKWPVGSKLWEEVKVDRTVAIDVRDVCIGDTFGGHELMEGTERITRACTVEEAVVLCVNDSDLTGNFLKSEIKQLLGLSKFPLPQPDDLLGKAKSKLQKLKAHVSAM
jgi:signal-transduction protein with cAMP-binding, CBS, and nucleotidyltransferase domain